MRTNVLGARMVGASFDRAHLADLQFLRVPMIGATTAFTSTITHPVTEDPAPAESSWKRLRRVREVTYFVLP